MPCQGFSPLEVSLAARTHVAEMDCRGGGCAQCARRVVDRSTYGFSNCNRDPAHRRDFSNAGVRTGGQRQFGPIHALAEHSVDEKGAGARHRVGSSRPCRAGALDFRFCAAGGQGLFNPRQRPDGRRPLGAGPSRRSCRIVEARREHRRHCLYRRRRGAESERRLSLLALRARARVAGISLFRPARHQRIALALARDSCRLGRGLECARDESRHDRAIG